jgi:hypothetical protein
MEHGLTLLQTHWFPVYKENSASETHHLHSPNPFLQA